MAHGERPDHFIIASAVKRIFLICLVFLMACTPSAGSAALGFNPPATPSRTPFQPDASLSQSAAGPSAPPAIPLSLASPSPVALASSPPPVSQSLYIASDVPEKLRQLALASGLAAADSAQAATLRLGTATSLGAPASSTWIYALVAAFPTVRDDVSLAALKDAWSGADARGLVMTESTYGALKSVLGEAGSGVVRFAPANGVVAALWQNRSLWGIVPFESLDPKLKVFSLDGQSPIDKGFEPAAYPLKVGFALQPAAFALPASNRDPAQLTTLLMTGTTALTRATAYKMQQNGVDYPARDILDWLTSADILHVSSEVPFTPDCPPPNPNDHHLRFCSAEKNIQLFDDIGVDVVELTGNHLNDYGTAAFANTLALYRQHGFGLFGGGDDLADAMQPLTMEKNGTRLAFIGCNVPGPTQAFATATTPGAAPCGDYGWITSEISKLKSQGDLVIATLQYDEYYIPTAPDNQVRDFQRLAEAGATIVSGSQSHFPQAMAFDGDSFIHYGPGNLFFDQMDVPVVGTRREFLDRHVFYNGKYISTELLTALLEDYARPRPMTPDERQQFLQTYFAASGW